MAFAPNVEFRDHEFRKSRETAHPVNRDQQTELGRIPTTRLRECPANERGVQLILLPSYREGV
jgi:hypothetical protein